MSVFQLQVLTIHIVFPYKHAKWYNIPIPIIVVVIDSLPFHEYYILSEQSSLETYQVWPGYKTDNVQGLIRIVIGYNIVCIWYHI